jgi:AcrR family transcriptional regulator
MRKFEIRTKNGMALSEKGQKTVKKILEAARDVLIEHGYEGFTMRKIAAQANLSLGNVNYYFKNKEQLINSLLDAALSGYESVFAHILNDEKLSPAEKFSEIVRIIVIDLGTKETTRFFPEIWAMANHNSYVQKQVNLFYQRARQYFYALIADINPAIDGNRRAALALFFSASIEGHTMFIGHRKTMAGKREEIAELSVSSFLKIIESDHLR